MRLLIAPFIVRAAILLAASTCVVACSSSNPAAESNFAVPGFVIDPNGNPVAGASVHFGDRPLTEAVLTDAQGQFTLNRTGGIGDKVVLIAQNANFTTATRPQVLTAAQNKTRLIMRLHDVVQTITAPGPTDPAVVLQAVSSKGGTATLTIPPGSLLLPNGAPATGQVTVRFSYWHPKSDLSTAPALLYGKEADGNTVHLQTFGMCDLSAEQNGQQLKINSSAPLAVKLPVADDQAYAIRNKIFPLPNAYVVDPNTGMWTYVMPVTAATAAAPAHTKMQGKKSALKFMDNPTPTPFVAAIYYDGNPPFITYQYLYFLASNIDYNQVQSYNPGGCVEIEVVDGCDGKPVRNHPVNLRIMNIEEVSYYSYYLKNGAPTIYSDYYGHACINVPQEIYPDDLSNFGAHYYLYGEDLDDTRQCRQYYDPGCYTCPFGQGNYCSNCRYGTIAGSTDANSPHQSPITNTYPSHDLDFCEYYHPYTSNYVFSPDNSFLVTRPCHFCPNQFIPDTCTQGNGANPSRTNGQPYDTSLQPFSGGCTLLTLKVSTPTCKCPPHGPGETPKPCAPPCLIDHQLGSGCDGSALSCCQVSGKTDLVCRDDVCVSSIYQ